MENKKEPNAFIACEYVNFYFDKLYEVCDNEQVKLHRYYEYINKTCKWNEYI